MTGSTVLKRLWKRLRASVVDLQAGDDIVLFLKAEDNRTAPGVPVDGGFYTPLNFSNGVLRVEGTELVATGHFPLAADTAAANAIEEVRGQAEAAGTPVEETIARIPAAAVLG